MGWRGIHAAWYHIVVILLWGLHRPRVCKGVLTGLREGQGGPVMLDASSRRHGWVGCCRGHLRGSEKRKFLGTSR